MLSPGTSTIQTRLRYFVSLPWIFRSLERDRVGPADFARRLRDREARLIDCLRPLGPARGVIGYTAGLVTSSVCLYAALEIATGEVTGACYPRHTHEEFLAFLNALVRAFPRKPLHVVLDNSSTHATPEVKRWLERHKRVHFHFTPTGASWLNMVEIWFKFLTKQQVRRGASITTSPN